MIDWTDKLSIMVVNEQDFQQLTSCNLEKNNYKWETWG